MRVRTLLQFIVGHRLHGYVVLHKSGRTGEDVDVNSISVIGFREEDRAERSADLVEGSKKSVEETSE